ncbi:MAG: PAS domain S-box protein, partial [Desulfobulbus sp.]
MINGENKTQSHEYAENIINTIREPLLVLNQNLKVVAASRSFYQFFKVKPEETVGQLIYDLGNQQWNIPKLRDLLETILPQKASFDDYEVEHNFSTIGRRVMLLNARQIEQAMGKERIILLAIEDITERKHLNNLLADSEERYRRIFETASDGIFLLEKYEGHIIQSNPAAEAMLGYSTEESVGKNLQDIGVPLDTSDFQMLMQKLQSKGILTYENIPVKTRMGQDIFADIYMVDRAKLAQCNIRDVTLRKQAEADLRIALEKAHQEKAMSEAIIASMGEMMVIVNTDFEIIFQNQIMKDFRGDHIGEHCYTVYEHRDRACEDCPVAKAFADGGIHKALMNPTTTDKGALWIEFTASALKNREGNIIAGVELVRDLTDQKKLEAQLRQSQKMEAIGTLAGGIAHDFNNILNVILGYGTMVLESLEAGSAAREDMNEVLTAAERAVHLTNRLLVFSRKKDFFLEPVDIKELILSLKKMLTKILRESTDFYLNLADGADRK